MPTPDYPILFLDIDGVLISHQSVAAERNGKWGIDPKLTETPTRASLGWSEKAVRRLRHIVARTHCGIVISSSWRGYPPSKAQWKWRQMFRCYDWPDAPVVGETPRLLPPRMGLWEPGVRGLEVAEWLKDKPWVPAYVCLDDDAVFLKGQPVVRTRIYDGLQDEHVDECIAILNRRE